MKSLKFIAMFAVLLIAFIVQPVIAQTTTDNIKIFERNNGLALVYDGLTVDSAGTVWSQAIDVTHFDNYTWTSDGVYIGGKANTAAGNPKLLLDYYVCYADPATNANWILGNDSLMTCNATTVFAANSTRFTTKAPWIKFKLTNLATGKGVINLDLGIYFYKRD